MLKIIAEIMIGHNRVIDNSCLPGNVPPEERLKSNQATQRAIHTTSAAVLVLLFTFTRLPLMALLSATVYASLASLMGCGHRTFLCGGSHLFASCRHLCATGRQRHRPCEQGQNGNQQYDGVYLSHYVPKIIKPNSIPVNSFTNFSIPVATNTPPVRFPRPQTPYSPAGARKSCPNSAPRSTPSASQ